MSRLKGGGFQFRIGVSMWGCACMEHRHPMLQLGTWRFVLRYPQCGDTYREEPA